jgi:glyoxylase-like metal-dependent hydrolase (beta-lactamase superfamily II)
LIPPPELLPGVHRIVLPMPFELSEINVYLVRLEEGYLLIDAGMNTPQTFQALVSGLERLQVPWSAIRQLLLTHMHPDHIGLAPAVLERSGAKLLMHHEDAQYLAEVADQEVHPAWLDQVLAEAGVPPAMVAEIAESYEFVQKSFRKLDPDQLLKGGESIPAIPGTLEVVWTPGHSPGHLCLYCPERKVLFSGDHILENITPNIGWHHGRDALTEYLESLDQLGRFDIELILPSHGVPFRGHREWIRNTVCHHHERCQQVLSALRVPRTAHELVSTVWPRTLKHFHHRFAVFELLAHLEHLRRRGLVVSEKIGTVVQWRATHSAGTPEQAS